MTRYRSDRAKYGIIKNPESAIRLKGRPVVCVRCGVEKKYEDFPISTITNTGIKTTCQSCFDRGSAPKEWVNAMTSTKYRQVTGLSVNDMHQLRKANKLPLVSEVVGGGNGQSPFIFHMPDDMDIDVLKNLNFQEAMYGKTVVTPPEKMVKYSSTDNVIIELIELVNQLDAKSEDIKNKIIILTDGYNPWCRKLPF